MAEFDPDAYLAKKSQPGASGGFDPDAYLAKKLPRPSAPEDKPDLSQWTRPGAQTIGQLEAGLNMGTGMIAKPVSDVMSLGAMAYDRLTGQTGDPEGFKRHIQEGMTYQPRTQPGRYMAESNPLSMIGRGVNWLGEKAEGAIAPEGSSPLRRSVGAGIHEAINQAPGFIGLKAPPMLESAASGLKSGAQRTMQSALKPTLKAQQTGKAARAVDTMLEEGINVSPGGVSKIQDRITGLNKEIADKIANSKAVVDKQAVMENMTGLLDKFSKQVNPLNDMAAIQKAFDEFDLTTQDKIPVREAQTLKQGTYKQLGDKSYGELKSADIEAQKTLARGLKEEIAKMVPEVSPLNAKESALLNALSVSERRVMMEANKNPFGLSWLTTDPVKFAGFMADRSGLFKSLVARMLNTTSEGLDAMAASGAPAAKAGGIAASADAEKEARYQAWKRKQEAGQ